MPRLRNGFMMFRYLIEVLMFTGIVEEVGRVTRIEQRGENRRITIAAGNAARRIEDRRQHRGQRSLLDRARHQARLVLRRPGSGDLGAHVVLAHA